MISSEVIKGRCERCPKGGVGGFQRRAAVPTVTRYLVLANSVLVRLDSSLGISLTSIYSSTNDTLLGLLYNVTAFLIFPLVFF